MLFNSFEFIFLFLPIVVIVYFLLNQKRLILIANIWLVISSLFFYGWWNFSYLLLLLLSIVINYGIGILLFYKKRKIYLLLGITFNVALLGYYKYMDFFIENINNIFSINIPLLKIILPLAISFFTFQQIAYIVDAYKKNKTEFNLVNYSLFVSFFPQLLAGPIVHYSDIIPQFQNIRKKVVNYRNLCIGLFLFSIGLFKKVILADTLAGWANQGFDTLQSPTLLEGWIVSLSYTFQLYFDFSGYMDMALGAALLFNIKLPINFDSPYKATNIQEVWSKWHITLGNFLYVYIYMPSNRFLLNRVFTPLGLKKKTMLRTNISMLILFFVSGIWHGAGWTFVVWGVLHGLATIVHRYWKKSKLILPKYFAWCITFLFINATMVIFRADSLSNSLKIFKGMLGLNGVVLPNQLNIFQLSTYTNFVSFQTLDLVDASKAVVFLILSFVIILCFKNSVQLSKEFEPKWYTMLFTILLFLYSLLNITKANEFLYYNF